MKKLFSLIISIVLFTHLSFGQDNSNVTITACGQGETQSEAQQAALRSAIEQAFGTFISAKTEILNDELISDQITSVSNGNIQSFEILNEAELPNGKWSTTLKAIVSVEKLTNFVQSKGVVVEIKGGVFAANIKQQILNENGEVKAIYNMAGMLHEVMQTAFDFTISTGMPQALDSENKNWKIPIEIEAVGNLNLDFAIEYLTKTLQALDLTNDEVQNYKSMNKPVFTTHITYFGFDTHSQSYIKHGFNVDLRKGESLKIIGFLSNLLRFYTTNFNISNNLPLDGIPFEFELTTKTLHKISENLQGAYLDQSLNFGFHKGSCVAKYSTFEEWDLENLNLLEGYEITPRGKISSFEQGGITMINNTYNTVLALIQPNMCEIKSIEENLKISFTGYDDWRIPTWEEMDVFNQFNVDFYPSMSRTNGGPGTKTWAQDPETGKIGINYYDDYRKYYNVSSSNAYIIVVRDGEIWSPSDFESDGE